MTKSLKSIVTAGIIGLSTLMPIRKVEAQLPFFNGQRAGTSTYALENRFLASTNSPEITDILIGKTFRKEIPVWGYVGISSNNITGLGNLFYGVGPIINFRNRLSMFPTLEGYRERSKGYGDSRISGVTVYSTLKLDHGFHTDLDPNFDSNLNYNSFSFNLGETYKGLTFGISSDFNKDGRLRPLRETDIRIARARNGSFIDVGINLGKKRFRIALQRAF